MNIRSQIIAALSAAAIIAFGKGGLDVMRNEKAMTAAANKAAARIDIHCNPVDVASGPERYTFGSYFGKQYDRYVSVSVDDRKPDGKGGSIFTMKAVDNYQNGTWKFARPSKCPAPR